MAAVVPEDFVRLKYRQKLHEPDMDDVKVGAHSVRKKVKPPQEDLSEEFKKMRFQPATMYPGHTQNTRVEQVIFSDDVTYRRENKPTLFEKVEITKQIMKQRLREERHREEMERQKNEERKKVAIQSAQEDGLKDDYADIEYDPSSKKKSPSKKNEHKEGDEEDGEYDGEHDDDAGTHDGEEGEQDVQDSDDEAQHGEATDADLQDMDEEELYEYRKQHLEKKERKILLSRNSFEFHYPIKKWTIRTIAWKTFFQMAGSKKGDTSTLMSWIEIGDAKASTQQHHLIERGITHILNCTKELKNEFPQQFVYLKIPIEDSDYTNFAPFFDQILNFFARVENKRGKLFIHDTSGASRAIVPFLVYLVANWQMPLKDAYEYTRLRRPIVLINDHFLFEVAKLEIDQGHGSSVMHHRDWKFYEFNQAVGDLDLDPKRDFRKSNGIIVTAQALWSKREEDEYF